MRFKEIFLALIALAAVGCKKVKRVEFDENGDEKQPVIAAGPASHIPNRSELGERLDTGAVQSTIEPDDFRTWYRIVGRAKTATPVVLIHDGPGESSLPLKIFEQLADERPVARYDQHGSGKSGLDLNPQHFLVYTYIAELDSVRTRGGFEKMHIVAHSWGAVIALEYYKRHPDRVASLTLESPEIDFPLLRESIRKRIATLPDSMSKLLLQPVLVFTLQRPDYQAALKEFGRRYVCCLRTPPALLDSVVRSRNDSVAHMLVGNLLIDGTLANYQGSAVLKNVKVPTLFITGDHDFTDTTVVRRYAAMTPGAQMVVLPGVKHYPSLDAPEENLRIVREFLRTTDHEARVREQSKRVQLLQPIR